MVNCGRIVVVVCFEGKGHHGGVICGRFYYYYWPMCVKFVISAFGVGKMSWVVPFSSVFCAD